ncbi:hypothetical protein [Francisella adeliensis]|uniref:Uncharacterized protein n=1 Tax=Francisella adeliensis TaxID=2007306 RepID=A0A2Z4Y1L7_9GAMM|nr:hypothetical protein [Francisella adeliensis]AXA34583.1 hypothetical protein CDH04_09325 [Francisella adeliensis]MBK2086307.1 hypothetical protein [Francisella adeliensis]MBK2096523.1 hypothetical protein [Francisella adeliensis]QIW12828.1 hypothetical protein FZC43_09340 [Francisella adeliensis]QIW14705.1 hypothetical protein FZC44_09330 [Francisella adeliensis]
MENIIIDNRDIVNKVDNGNSLNANFSRGFADVMANRNSPRLGIKEGALTITLGDEKIDIKPVETYDSGSSSEKKRFDAMVQTMYIDNFKFSMSFEVSMDTYSSITKHMSSANGQCVSIKLASQPFDDKQFLFHDPVNPGKSVWSELVNFMSELSVSCDGQAFSQHVDNDRNSAMCGIHGGIINSKSCVISFVTGGGGMVSCKDTKTTFEVTSRF